MMHMIIQPSARTYKTLGLVAIAATTVTGMTACGSSSPQPSPSASASSSSPAGSAVPGVPTSTEKSTSRVSLPAPETVDGVQGVTISLDKTVVPLTSNLKDGDIKVGISAPESLAGKTAYLVTRDPEFDPEIWDSGTTLISGAGSAIGATTITSNTRTRLFQLVVTEKPVDAKYLEPNTALVGQSQVFTIYVDSSS